VCAELVEIDGTGVLWRKEFADHEAKLR
jgi:hypothetical protein